MSRFDTVKAHPITKALGLMLLTVFLFFWVQELWWLHTQYRLNQDKEAAVRFQKFVQEQQKANPPAPTVKPPTAPAPSTPPAPVENGKGG